MASLIDLYSRGQSVWFDYIDRRLLADGGFKRLTEIGVRGVTSNPTIFHQAISASDAYDGAIRDLIQADPEIDAARLYEWLTVQDVQLAADQLRHVFDTSQGADGYVSLEVSPHLADDTDGTVSAARHLWKTVRRPNVMIKVPATPAGIPALERLIAEGINVNATLLFSVARYEEVARAYLRGLDRCSRPAAVASVASVFVSRIDTKVDRVLERVDQSGTHALRGRIAIANSKMVYQRFRALFGQPLPGGRRLQRPLWASTGTKNPKYSDVLYVEELIGPDTVSTVPQETLNAFLHHGTARASLEADTARAEQDLAALRALGVDFDGLAAELEREGVAKFTDSYEETLRVLRERRSAVAKRYAG
jgi:transaldolase